MSVESLRSAGDAGALLAMLLRPARAPALAAPAHRLDVRVDRATALSRGDLVETLTGARTALLRLADAARGVDARHGLSVFSAAIVRSTDPAVVRARVLPGADLAQLPADGRWRIDVTRLATAQQNDGAPLPSDGVGAIAAGHHTVRITQAGKPTDVAFDVEASDTNADALDRFAAAVNAAQGLGVVAEVVAGPTANTSRLVLAARETGAGHAFGVADATGSAVTSAAVESATAVAASAVYTVDGAVLTSDTNAILLGADGGIEVTLAARTAVTVEVSVTPDAARIGAAVTALVRSYNAARRFFDSHKELFAGTAAALRSLGSRFRAALGSVGAVPDADGGLSVEAPALRTALAGSFGVVREALGGEYGVAGALGVLAERQLAAAEGGLDPLPGMGMAYAPRTLVYQASGAGTHWPPRLFDGHA